MKALAVLFTLTVGILLSGPAQAREISDLPQTLMASGAAGTIQLQPASDLPKAVNVEIRVGKVGEGQAWYLSPVWMAIGGLGLVLMVILIAMAARGGASGTTVVRG